MKTEILKAITEGRDVQYTYSDDKRKCIQTQNIGAEHDWYVYIAHKVYLKLKIYSQDCIMKFQKKKTS